MRLLVNGKEVIWSTITYLERIDRYYPTILVQIPFAVPADEFTLIDKAEKKYKVIGVAFSGQGFMYTCCAKDTYELFSNTYQPVYGNYSVPELCREAGIPCMCVGTSSKSQWLIPKSKLANILLAINKYAVHDNGGGCRAYLDDIGTLHVIDMKSLFEGKGVDIPGDVLEDSGTNEWFINTASTADVFKYQGLTVEKETVTLSNVSKGSIFVNDTTGFLTDLKKQQLRNEYWVAYYTARKLRIKTNGILSVRVGEIVTYGTYGKLLVTGIDTTISSTGSNIPNCILTLHRQL